MKTAMMPARHTASAACFGGSSSCAHMTSESFDRAISVFLDAGILASIIICLAIGNLQAVLGLQVGKDYTEIPGAWKRA